MAHSSDQTGKFDSLAGAEFIAAIAGDAFSLVQAGDFSHGESLGRAVLDADPALGAGFRAHG